MDNKSRSKSKKLDCEYVCEKVRKSRMSLAFTLAALASLHPCARVAGVDGASIDQIVVFSSHTFS